MFQSFHERIFVDSERKKDDPLAAKKLKSLPLNYFGTLWGLDNAVYVWQNMNFCPVILGHFYKVFFWPENVEFCL